LEYRTSALEEHGELPEFAKIDAGVNEVREKAAKKRAEDDAKAAAEQKIREEEAAKYDNEMRAAWITPYPGGKVYCESEVWNYTAQGQAESADEIIYNFDGSSLSGSMYGSGSWNGTTLSWHISNRTIYSFTLNNGTFVSQTNLELNWKWDGTMLKPLSSDSNVWGARNVRFDGKVPVPVLLVIAMRKFASHRYEEISGAFLCKSALWNEGVVAKTCDKCSTNHKMRCAVCQDGLPFPRNEALMCKFCSNYITSCVKCGGSFPYTPAFVCDSCLYAFKGNCIRTTRH